MSIDMCEGRWEVHLRFVCMCVYAYKTIIPILQKYHKKRKVNTPVWWSMGLRVRGMEWGGKRGWGDRWLARWVDGWMDGWVDDGWVAGRIGGFREIKGGWMSGWLDRWMD